MSSQTIVQKIENAQLKKELPAFKVGDTVNVHTKIIEGDKERVQIFTGIVVARYGKGVSETFTVYRVAYKFGMEKVFTLHSPRIVKIELVSAGDVRKAKLNYIRGKTGKAAKVKEKIGGKRGVSKKTKAAAPETKQPETNPDESNEEKPQSEE